MTPHRFFRSDEATYESVRATLDAAWGLPNDKATTTCIAPANTAPRDASGRLLVGLLPEWLTWEPAATLLPQLLSSGAVEEITDADYQAALLPPDPLQG
jgi:hypothetical protein